jgi:hypothetical protein
MSGFGRKSLPWHIVQFANHADDAPQNAPAAA